MPKTNVINLQIANLSDEQKAELRKVVNEWLAKQQRPLNQNELKRQQSIQLIKKAVQDLTSLNKTISQKSVARKAGVDPNTVRKYRYLLTSQQAGVILSEN